LPPWLQAAAGCHDHCYSLAHEIVRKFRQLIELTVSPAKCEHNVASHCIAGLAEPLAERRHELSVISITVAALELGYG
jgi:hypothetical protein